MIWRTAIHELSTREYVMQKMTRETLRILAEANNLRVSEERLDLVLREYRKPAAVAGRAQCAPASERGGAGKRLLPPAGPSIRRSEVESCLQIPRVTPPARRGGNFSRSRRQLSQVSRALPSALPPRVHRGNGRSVHRHRVPSTFLLSRLWRRRDRFRGGSFHQWN